MRKAHNKDGRWVFAEDAVSGNEYFCPECRERLTLIQGSFRVMDHFRHLPGSTCGYGEGESIAHETAKHNLAQALAGTLGASNVATEYLCPDGQRPDIYFKTAEGRGVAVEVQYSAITEYDLTERTASYADKDIAAMWLTGGLSTELRRLPTWERSGLAMLPLWMRRIAEMFENQGYEPPQGDLTAGAIIPRIGLTSPVQQVSQVNGTWVQEWVWPTVDVDLATGAIYETTDHRGRKRLLWYPSPIDGTAVITPRRRRGMTRRELADDAPFDVNCPRVPAEALVPEVAPLPPARRRSLAALKMQMCAQYLRDLEAYAAGDRSRFDRMVDARGVRQGSPMLWRSYVARALTNDDARELTPERYVENFQRAQKLGIVGTVSSAQ